MSATPPLRSVDDLAPVGVGLKSQHYAYILEARPNLAFFEIHAENYMSPGGAHRRFLDDISQHYALSLHGVGMSLGSAGGVDAAHVARFRDLVEAYRPWLVSEHLAWSRTPDGVYLNDLLPLPLIEESLQVVADNVSRLQDAIGRAILIENPSSYLAFSGTTIPEPEFISRLAERTGCGLLLDVNNVFVSARNMDWSGEAYLDGLSAALVGEIHLAGHALKDIGGTPLRIDDHGRQVPDDVWALYKRVVERIGPRPTLVEWDNDVPEFETLAGEAWKAETVMREGSNHDQR